MQGLLNSALKTLLRLGIIGIFGLSVIDSTFFVFLPPLIIDGALVLFISRRAEWMPLYALFATAGSLAGCTLDYLIIGKSSEKTLEKILPKQKFEHIKSKMRKNAFWSLLIASLMPPPFPFSPFI